MNVLIVASCNAERFSPFVLEQAASLSNAGAMVDFFGIKGKGVKGYLSNRKYLLAKIREFKPDLIHAHYGLSGLLANMQRDVPVITTYHGSDIHSGGVLLLLSKICMRLSAHNIFVGTSLLDQAKYRGKKYTIQSCGLLLSDIYPVDMLQARSELGLRKDKIYILFSGSFSNPVKNYELAKLSVELAGGCELIELAGYTKKQVALLMNACNLQLTTSLKESGPLVVKEAMACNRPIVTTDVGDVRWIVGNTKGCYITSFDPQECAERISQAIAFSQNEKHTNGRDRIISLGLDSKAVADKIMGIYNDVIHI